MQCLLYMQKVEISVMFSLDAKCFTEEILQHFSHFFLMGYTFIKVYPVSFIIFLIFLFSGSTFLSYIKEVIKQGLIFSAIRLLDAKSQGTRKGSMMKSITFKR